MFLVGAAGRAFGTRVALVSVGASAIKKQASRRLVLAAARLANYRSFRNAGIQGCSAGDGRRHIGRPRVP